MEQDAQVFAAEDLRGSIANVGDPAVEQASQPFVGRWSQLVSTTNWEKGRIIAEWRAALVATGAPAAESTDEAWARRVGGVTGQHVGRLRRVHQRFGTTRADYAGIYWSHFHAALDWDDAELWLEGAVQSRWSVSEMRRSRWQAMGAVLADQPRDVEIISAELDEDADPTGDQEGRARPTSGEFAEPGAPLPEGPDFGDEEDSSPGTGPAFESTEAFHEPVTLVRPFENLPELPQDLAEAFESFKLAILRHKAEQWHEISCGDVLASLDALKALAVAPSLD